MTRRSAKRAPMQRIRSTTDMEELHQDERERGLSSAANPLNQANFPGPGAKPSWRLTQVPRIRCYYYEFQRIFEMGSAARH